MPLFKPEHRQLLKMLHPAREEEVSDVLSGLAAFMEEKISPLSPKFDSLAEKISSSRKSLLENGICLIPYPSRYGGLDLPFSAYTTAIELAGAADASVALSVAIHNTVADGIFLFGSEAQKKTYLPGIISGKKLASFSLTEPASGSDAKAVRTTARRVGREYVLNGTKMFITNAGEADLYFVLSATEKGPSSFIVEKSAPGLEFGEDLPKLGMRGSRTSEVRLTDCRISAENLVGREGEGFEQVKTMLNSSRIVMGALCVGVAQVAYEKAVTYSKERRAFGGLISDFQLIREKIADMVTGISAARLLCLYASRLKEMGLEFSSEASQAKVFATETSVRVCDQAIQIFGGLGYTSEDVHRHWRDARLLTIGEGTSEVLRMLIAGRELARSL